MPGKQKAALGTLALVEQGLDGLNFRHHIARMPDPPVGLFEQLDRVVHRHQRAEVDQQRQGKQPKSEAREQFVIEVVKQVTWHRRKAWLN